MGQNLDDSTCTTLIFVQFYPSNSTCSQLASRKLWFMKTFHGVFKTFSGKMTSQNFCIINLNLSHLSTLCKSGSIFARFNSIHWAISGLFFFPTATETPDFVWEMPVVFQNLFHTSTCPHPSSLHTTLAVAIATDALTSCWQTGSHLPLILTSRFPRQLSPRFCSQRRTGSSSSAQGKTIHHVFRKHRCTWNVYEHMGIKISIVFSKRQLNNLVTDLASQISKPLLISIEEVSFFQKWSEQSKIILRFLTNFLDKKII